MNPPAVQAPTGPPPWPPGVRVVLLDALSIDDGGGVSAAPGALLLETAGVRDGVLRRPARVLAVGSPQEVRRHPAAPGAYKAEFPQSVLIPGLVNAHTHLDLTDVGPQPFDPAGGFMGWIDLVRRRRPTDDESIARAVQRGVELSLAGGTVAVGDIAGAPAGKPSLIPWQTLAASGLPGTSFLEFFAIGRGEEGGLARAQAAVELALGATGEVRFGLQPHAPNTVSLRAYRWAADRGLPLATHLAESEAECQFVGRARGPQREFLDRIGLWDNEMLTWLGQGRRPVQHLAPVLERGKFLLAHVNAADDADLAILGRTGQSVVYCPRASEYFGNHLHLGPHRYRDMLGAGIPVALGTDSIINLPEHAADPSQGGIGVLDEMRLLWRRDRTDPRTLLAMATINGGEALGLSRDGFVFEAGARPLGILAVSISPPYPEDPHPKPGLNPDGSHLKQLLESDAQPIVLLAER